MKSIEKALNKVEKWITIQVYHYSKQHVENIIDANDTSLQYCTKFRKFHEAKVIIEYLEDFIEGERKLLSYKNVNEIKNHVAMILDYTLRMLFADPDYSTNDFSIIEYRAKRKCAKIHLEICLVINDVFQENELGQILTKEQSQIINFAI